MIALGTVVDWEALLDTALASLAAGVVVTLAVSAAIFGTATFADARREERYTLATLAALAAIVGAIAFAAAIAAGLYVMIDG